MKIADMIVAHDGKPIVLSAAGEIYSGERPNDIQWQHIPKAKRPDLVWTKLDCPAGKVTKLIAGTANDVWVIIDRKLHRRQPVAVPPFGRVEMQWVEVPIEPPGEAPEPAAAPTRILIQEFQNPGGQVALTGGSFILYSSVVVAFDKYVGGSVPWRPITLKDNRFFAGDGDVVRVSFGSDPGRAQIFREAA